ncbi:hypothetical protein ACOSOMT5_P2946 [Acidiphilium sp. MT5]
MASLKTVRAARAAVATGLANRPAGEAIRALAWLGPERAEAALTALKQKMPPGVFGELVAAAPQLPTWLAQSVGRAAYG